MTLKKTPRWIAPMIKEAEACATKMPWERGVNRKATLAARKALALRVPEKLSA